MKWNMYDVYRRELDEISNSNNMYEQRSVNKFMDLF